jgi:RNA polymerase-binding transcription factor DksA
MMKKAKNSPTKKAVVRKPAKDAKIARPKKAVKPTPLAKTARKAPKRGEQDLASYGLDPARIELLKKALKGPHARHLKILLNLRDRLLDDIEFYASDNLKRTRRDASRDLSAYSFHMADAGTDNFDREFALSMVSNEQEALYEINDAIKRIENSTYGICEMSGKPIPRARLDVIPWTRYTVECQTEVEKNNHRRPRDNAPLSAFDNTEEESTEKREEEE